MDSLTQIVLGAAVGEAVLGRKIGNKAMLYGAIAGTIPDLDVMAQWFTDTVTATEMHRGFSHSIVFAILVAPLLGWLTNKLERKKDLGWKPWAWLFFWGLFTHPLLDMFTTWGTQFFWPVEWRIAFNSIFVIDPFYTLPFLGCVVAAMFMKRSSLSRKQINLTGLIYSTSYLFLSLLLKQFALAQFTEALDQQGISYKQIATRPAPLNTILWNANIETETAYLMADYSFFDTQAISFTSFPKNRAQEWEPELAEAQEKIQRLKDIAQGWYLMEEKNGVWYFYDLRFGRMPVSSDEAAFVFSYQLIEKEDASLEVAETKKRPSDASLLLQQLWERIKGN